MNPILIDIPDQIETERLIIRPPRVSDGPMVNEAILESLTELKPWLPWAQTAPTVEETTINIRQAVAKFIERKDLRLQFHLKDGSFVGGSGLHRIDWDVPRFETGYWVRTSCVGRGYVTEAVNAIATLAFGTLKAKRVEIKCDTENVRSRKVAEACRFELEGVLRNDSLDPEGRIRSTAIYSRIASGDVTA